MLLRQFIRANHSFSQLQGILSKMKVISEHKFPESITKAGTSDMFNYATNPKFKREDLKTNRLETWNRLQDYDLKHTSMQVPMNGFEEAIQLTEEGRLWKYPIDNEAGMEAEQQVPFEDHVFLDKHLEDFPKNESIRQFMGFVVAGLAKNPWMTAERKRETIRFYKNYFEHHRDTYKQTGLDI